MSYHRHRQPLGDIASLIKGATQGLSAATNILQDPYFNEVAGLVVRLHNLEQPATVPGKPAPPPVPGVGLSNVVGPLRTYVKVRENPWMLYAGVFAVLAIPFAIGRASKRRG